MVRSVCQSSRHHPRTRSFHVKKRGFPLPPTLVLGSKQGQALSAILRISMDECQPCFLLWQRRRRDVDAQHGAAPEVLAHALMHHLFADASLAPIAFARTHRQVLVAEFAPQSTPLPPFDLVGLNVKAVSHC